MAADLGEGVAVSPYEINVLLHYYSRVNDHEDIDRNPPAWRLTIEAFMGQGLLRGVTVPDHGYPRCYELTERGTAYCEALQRIPLPIQVWVTPAVPEFRGGK